MNIISDFIERNIDEIDEHNIEHAVTLITDAFENNDVMVDDIHLDNNGTETGIWWITIDAPYGLTVNTLTLICDQLQISYDSMYIGSTTRTSKMEINIC